MKKSYIFIALAMVSALSIVSCKCSSKKSQEPTQEEIQAQKQALADSVLKKIDAFADVFFQASENRFHFRRFELTEQEKLVKPDYLLDPLEADKFVTKSQKVSALAIYIIDMGVREIYDMPTEKAREVIAKFVADLNYPYDIDQRDADIPRSERIKQEYNKCKENGDLAFFWQFQNVVIGEVSYILSQNPELFFSKITEEQLQQFVKWVNEKNKAMRELAKYDADMANVLEFNKNISFIQSPDEFKKSNATIESSKQFRIANKDKYIARRNAFLQ